MSSHQYQVLKHSSGKRIAFAADGKIVRSPKALAQSVGLAETTAREVISGKIRKGWQSVTMQRRRECMRISYTLTKAGREEAARVRIKERKGLPAIALPVSAFQVFLSKIEAGEASDISEAMIVAGFPLWDRQRVLCESAKALRLGYITKDKQSGAIFGNL